ncbi:hypothetical protein [Xenorhabdus doucetiae]|uniref:Uncharacterized protein n=1 Tax=Xenorhabdus doucetiae TaxID=351671 RepID=A0A068QTU0_9GAMM|nr:hypothetical protein [Xenorhabdus doucetiae]TYP11578.1 hypothetical protein LY16_01064 [Xenorhabdus doucetiae]CDG18437.1 protein of unknown function [Xenorhabdus doucetiae]
MNIPYQYHVNYQQPYDWTVLKGKSASSIPEHYYLFKDENGNIKIMLYCDNGKPVMSKDLLVIKNKYLRGWSHSIYASTKK